MDKQTLLNQVKQAAAIGLISEAELVASYRGIVIKPVTPKSSNLSKILYLIGGLIVLLGIVILVAQNWLELGSVARVVITLGSGLAAYIAGLLFVKQEKTEFLGYVFLLLSFVLMPLGVGVTFYETGVDFNAPFFPVMFSGILFLVYLLSWLLLRYQLMAIASIIFGTALFFTLTNYLVFDVANVRLEKFWEYRILVVGLIYILLGFNLTNGNYKRLTPWLYTFGLLGFLGSTLALGGYAPEQNVFWELVFPALAFGVLLSGIPLKSRPFLFVGSLFIMIYIVKISTEYFKNSMGWALALVLAGLALMAVGYLSFYLNRRYITQR